MKTVIFGGGGFIGSAISDRLLLDGHKVRIFERPRVAPYREFGKSERVEWVTGDMQSPNDLASAIDGVDAVLHLVSSTLPKNSNEDTIFDVQSNLVAIHRFLQKHGISSQVVNITRHRKPDGDSVYYPKDWTGLCRLLLRLRFDIVHLHIGGTVTLRLLALSFLCCAMPRSASSAGSRLAPPAAIRYASALPARL